MNDGLALLLLAAGVVVLLLFLGAIRGGGSGKGAPVWRPGFGADGTSERPFTPTVSAPGIALDDVHGWVWLATKENGCILLDRATVREWSHEWRSMPNGERWQNELTFRLADVKMPVVRVPFGRNHRLAEEWQARLTTWMNG